MKRLLFILIGCLISAAASGQETRQAVYRMTLEDCLEYAMGNSYDREAVRLNEEAREIEYDQSKMERLPNLSASISENINHAKDNSASWDGNYGLSTNIPIYQGGNINASIEQSRLYSEQAVYQTYQYDNQLTINILQNFLAIVGYEEMLNYQQAVVKASEEQLKQGEAQYAVGMILESDYLLLKAQYASDLNNINETLTNLQNNLLSLKGLLSMEMESTLQIVPPDTAIITQLGALPSREYAAERALLTLPDLEVIRYSVEIAQANLRIARSDLYPTVSLGGSIGSGHSNNFQNYGDQVSNRFNQQAGLSVSIPIFSRGRTRSNIARGKVSLRQAELDEMQTELDVKRTVLQEYNDVSAAFERYQTARVKEEAYRKSFDAYGVMFSADAITTVELLQQQNNYISALNDYIQSKYDFIFRRKVLDVYMGERIKM